ncbi:metallophosphoesterase [Ideonella sp. A 288]|uniref:metallophosphoesterase n=1 Tax=Ideonella sp. A 288 TaxID=1962181 RepID=UPI000B4B2EF5|nr:metallophosphoesterase [Ideonella sp. A 288]
MTALKYVCLSDLHLGADYSLFTRMDEDGHTSLRLPSRSLEALGAALRPYVASLSGAEPPTLILLGDMLDMGLSPMGDVARAWQRFVEVMFPADQPPVFSPQVICVPGNHDHHLWRSAQDQEFLERVLKADESPKPLDLIHTTKLFAPLEIECDLMTKVMRSQPGLAEATVRVAYPNLGLRVPGEGGRERCVVLHHGHYVDGTYRVMSTLDAAMEGLDAPPASMGKLEAQNGAWVDFLWSDLGSSGAVGKDATTLYETMRDAGASHQFAQGLSERVLALLASKLGVGADTEVVMGLKVSNLVKALIDLTLVRTAETERDSYFTVMSDAGVADLRWFVGGPVRRQLEKAGLPASDTDLSFVFGHTHKPFQDQFKVPGFIRPVAVYNTGGWVMDQPTMAPTQGAAAVFIDDALNLASLRLFNDPLNGEAPAVHVAGVGGFLDEANPLLKRMTDALGPTAEAWATFSQQVRWASERHAECLLDRFFDPQGASEATPS